MSESDNDNGYLELQPNSKCLFCAAVLPLNFTLVNGKVTPIKEENDLAPCFIAEGGTLDKQLQVVFILRNILHIPEGTLCKFLAELNPQFWFQVCGVCGDAVRLFYDTLKEISKLRRILDGVTNQLKTKVYATKDEEANEVGNAVIWKEIREEILQGFEDGSEEINVKLPQEEFILPMDDDHDDSDNGSEQWESDENDSKSETDEYQPPTKLRKGKLSKGSFPPSKKRLLAADAPFVGISEDIPYYCDHCQMIFTTEHKLKHHFTSYHAAKHGVLNCTERGCELEFERKQLLNFHLKGNHPEANPEAEEQEQESNCEYCELIFSSKSKRDFHVALSHRAQLLTCVPCNKPFKNYKSYQVHLETTKSHNCEGSATLNSHTCELCGKGCPSAVYLKIHKRQEHGAELGLQPISCQECGKVMSSQRYLRAHMNAVHLKIKTLACEFCGKEFAYIQSLRQHIKRHHEGPGLLLKERHFRPGKREDGKETWLCDFCTVQFPNLQSVRTHLLVVHYDQLKYVCDGCQKRFVTSIGLYRHRKSCTEVETEQQKMFSCQFCSKEYYTRTDARKHERKFHKDRFTHKCQKCDKVFRTLTTLMNHANVCGGASTEVKGNQEISSAQIN